MSIASSQLGFLRPVSSAVRPSSVQGQQLACLHVTYGTSFEPPSLQLIHAGPETTLVDSRLQMIAHWNSSLVLEISYFAFQTARPGLCMHFHLWETKR